jgi:hypothetical protein
MGNNAIALATESVAMGGGTVAIGNDSFAMGNACVSTGFAAVAMGSNTTASGNFSVALGQGARTNAMGGSFIYGDASTSTIIDSAAQNEFAVRASGGFRLFTNSTLTAGVTMGAGAGAWSTVSDRNAKQDFADIDGRDVLAKIAKLPIQTWRYKAETSRALHVGPVAQDFRAAFGLGDSDKTISTVDIDGVNMLAIQALARENAELRARLERLERAASQRRETK